MSEFATVSPAGSPPRIRNFPSLAPRLALPLATIAVFAAFSVVSPAFLVPTNVLSILTNNFALQAIIALAMTLAVTSGGIDLSVGTAVDFASFAFVTLVLAGQPVPVAAVAGLGAGLVVGLFNGFLIAVIGISPFLATLGTLFIGRSIQQQLTNGGNPVYLPQTGIPDAFRFLGHGSLFGVPVTLAVAVLLLALFGLYLGRSSFGRTIIAIGTQPVVSRFSGLRVARTVTIAYGLAALVAAIAGILLTATVSVYIPNSGNAFLLNAIGATFIGTTLSPLRRPNIPGTALGVLLLAIVANGLLLSGLNFYWQQVGTGLLIFAVLAFSFLRGR